MSLVILIITIYNYYYNCNINEHRALQPDPQSSGRKAQVYLQSHRWQHDGASRRTGGAHVHTTRTVHTEKYTVSIMSGPSQRDPLYMLAVCNVLGHLWLQLLCCICVTYFSCCSYCPEAPVTKWFPLRLIKFSRSFLSPYLLGCGGDSQYSINFLRNYFGTNINS